jgi:hypothetical protein
MTIERKRLMNRDVANKIADALGLSKDAYRVEIVFDWRSKSEVFSVVEHRHISRDEGEQVVDVAKEAGPQGIYEPTPYPQTPRTLSQIECIQDHGDI